MVRLRLPGGRTTGRTLRRLAEIADAYGTGIVQLTSRAGLQLRGLPDPLPVAFVDAVTATGLLPAASHERVRNIVTSPLSGLVGGRADLTALTAALDTALVADPALAELPGRFLFVLDDGRGDVQGLTFDLGYQAAGPDAGTVLVGSPDRGFGVAAADAVSTLLRLARQFLEARAESGAWHVSELPGWVDGLGLGAVDPVRGTGEVPSGVVGDAASVGVPLARLTRAQVIVVAQVTGDGPVVITPWRGLVLPGAAHRLAELAAVGLIVAEEDVWSRLTACVGAPYCSRALIDTGAVARVLADAGRSLPRTHLSGCERRCGAPTGAHLELVAPDLADAVRAVDHRVRR